jgi:hypothetical protein
MANLMSAVPDFLDLKALERLAEVHERIGQLYRPGLNFTLYLEDVARTIVTGREWVEYPESLAGLVKKLGFTFIKCVHESEFIHTNNYRERIRQNAEKIRSGRAEAIGWIGQIDWDHFLTRARSEKPDATEDELRERVSLFLASVLGRSQEKLWPQHDLKISFVPYDKSVPDSMRRFRLEYKVKPGKDSHCIRPPWAHFGLLTGDGWSTVGVNELRRNPYAVSEYCHGSVTVPVLLAES